MSVFKDAVQDCLDCQPKAKDKPVRLKRSGNTNDADVEKYSGLRIRFVGADYYLYISSIMCTLYGIYNSKEKR